MPRPLLAALALAGLAGPNGWFLWLAARDFPAFLQMLMQPLPLILLSEALVVTGLLAWLIHRNGWRPGAVAFIAMSLAGGLVFSVPAWLWCSRLKSSR